MFYYLIVIYNIHDIVLEDRSQLHGSFDSTKEMDDHLAIQMEELSENLCNVTKFEMHCELGKLEHIGSETLTHSRNHGNIRFHHCDRTRHRRIRYKGTRAANRNSPAKIQKQTTNPRQTTDYN